MNKNLLHIISHTDLDGVVAAALAWHNNYGTVPIKISLAGYGIVDNLILESIQYENDIILLDLFFQKDSTADRIEEWYSQDDPPFIFDHHQSNLARYSSRPWLFLDTDYCAALVYYNWLTANPEYIRNQEVLEKMERIVRIANDRDLWINRFPESRLWNALVTLCGPWGTFSRLITDPDGDLTTLEHDVASDFIEKQEKRFVRAAEYISKVRKDLAFVGDGVLEFGDVSDFAGMVLDRSEDPPALLAVAARKISGEWAVSLRSREDLAGKTVSMLKDGKKVRGGGHGNAAALYFPPSYSENRIRESLEVAIHTIREKDEPSGATLGDVFREAMKGK